MTLIEVNRKTMCLTFVEGASKLVLCNGRAITKIGYFSPVAYSKALKQYHAIINEM